MEQETNLQESSELQEVMPGSGEPGTQVEGLSDRQQVLVFIAGPSVAVTHSILSCLEKHLEDHMIPELKVLIKPKFVDASNVVYKGLLNQYVNSQLGKETKEAVLKEQLDKEQKLKAYNAAWGLYELMSIHPTSPWLGFKPHEITFTEGELYRYVHKTGREVSHKELAQALEFYALHGMIVAVPGQEMVSAHKLNYQFCFTTVDEEVYLNASIEEEQKIFNDKKTRLSQLKKELSDVKKRKRLEAAKNGQQRKSSVSKQADEQSSIPGEDSGNDPDRQRQ